jgi:hypothetical protein
LTYTGAAEQRCLSGDRVFDVCAALEQHPCGFNNAELCGHVQQGRSLKEAAGARTAAIEFGKPPVRQVGVRFKFTRRDES